MTRWPVRKRPSAMPEPPARLRSFELWLELTPGEDPSLVGPPYSEAARAARRRYGTEFLAWCRDNDVDPVDALRERARWRRAGL
jgi:hypothetical protein